MSTQLIRTIQSKLPAAALDQVCENAPNGDHPDGGTYKDHCLRCLDLARNDEGSGGDNRESQALCVAGVIGLYLENEATTEEISALTDGNDDTKGSGDAAGDASGDAAGDASGDAGSLLYRGTAPVMLCDPMNPDPTTNGC